MTRSCFSDDGPYDYPGEFCQTWYENAIRGKRGQRFLRELLATLDAMPEKRLIKGKLIDGDEVCALGSVYRARGFELDHKVDPTGDEYGDHHEPLAKRLGIARSLVAFIEHINDDDYNWRDETPEECWQRVRQWVAKQIKAEEAT